ncbi:MAG: TlpA family protein disulfide reductase [Deltaproteobacteria bacterium]|nr:TlpA family protein disulfide reductase [Deltaproteobacteria bacterium]
MSKSSYVKGIILCLVFTLWLVDPAACGAPVSGEIAPSFRLTTIDGRTFSLDASKGKVVVINFWASWCGPCRVEAPYFEKAYREFKARRIEFIGIAVDDSPNDVKAFIKREGLSFPIGLDDTGDIAKLYKVNALPKTIIVGKDGRIKLNRMGLIREADLFSEIKRNLAMEKD